MNRHNRHLQSSAMLAILVTNVACGWQRRPSGVPDGAVRVPFSESGGWAYCWLDKTIHLNRCRTYNSAGDRLYRFRKENDDDDVFLRYQGSVAVPEEELQIDIIHTGPDVIWLQNGVILLPRNDFEHQKQFVGELMRAGAKGSP
jgi:hypothetical protein